MMRGDDKDRTAAGSHDGSTDDGKKEGGFPANLPPAYVGRGLDPDDVGESDPTLEPVPREELEEEFPDEDEDERAEERREGPRR